MCVRWRTHTLCAADVNTLPSQPEGLDIETLKWCIGIAQTSSSLPLDHLLLATPSGQTTTAYCFNVLVIRRIAKCAGALEPSLPLVECSFVACPASLSVRASTEPDTWRIRRQASPALSPREPADIKCFLPSSLLPLSASILLQNYSNH